MSASGISMCTDQKTHGSNGLACRVGRAIAADVNICMNSVCP